MNGMIIGIDPGFTGAIACYFPASGDLVVEDMPTAKNPKGKTELLMPALLELLRRPDEGEVWLEQVAAMPGQGVSSVFRFGQTYGAIQMAVAASQRPLRLVTPTKWKGHFGIAKGKDLARGLASQRFPRSAGDFTRKKDDGRAEAALIALYGAEKGLVVA